MAAETPEQAAALAAWDASLRRPVCECPHPHGLLRHRCFEPAVTYSRWHACLTPGGAELCVMCERCDRDYTRVVASRIRGWMARAGRPLRCNGCGMAIRSVADVLLEVGDLP